MCGGPVRRFRRHLETGEKNKVLNSVPWQTIRENAKKATKRI